ncbi:hypothetical protein HN031_13435 [Nocardioides sp. zg-1308]|uniref:Uncharacterized protein n=1 Tax=Nocardioides renjunii TaxID=3095075 RepID=A0ABU5KCE3_9ACTN|nr:MULTISPECIES: hypothetical protein [unclassified Nocardioides]MDZ5662643.1 hypothetical protein [Nocardioides sp. S-58]NPD05688.1 hypothetical protein [Nocardioides sp. zg-1308]WQQ23568.1 hypothetical protein SHK17_06170 [Nocardioides sp. S-34]
MSAHRLAPAPRVVPRTTGSERLHLLLAACCALTLMPLGLTMAVVVLAVLVARRQARRSLQRSVAVGRGILAPAQQPRVLHTAGHRRQAVARP